MVKTLPYARGYSSAMHVTPARDVGSSINTVHVTRTPRLTSSPTIGPLVPEIVKLVTERDRIKEDVVKQLEKALELARNGDIVAVAIAMVDKEGRGNYRWSEGDMATTMVGAVQRMQHMLNVTLDENVNWIEDTSDDPA